MTGITDEMREEARRLVRENYGEDVTAWLAGSRVSGEYRPDSDLDVVVEVTPSRMKQGGRGGAGIYIEDTECGVPIDITEDEDGPVWHGEDAQERLFL